MSNNNLNQNTDTQDEQHKINIQNHQEDEEEAKRAHRRSKNDTDGRTYVCKICGKSYLSYPALYTHSKQKHNTCNNTGRGRGRPKKEIADVRLYFN